MKKVLYIFGGRSTAVEMAELAGASGKNQYTEIYHLVPDAEAGRKDNWIAESQAAAHIAANQPDAGFIISMADAAIRHKCLQMAAEADLQSVSLIHPQAVISSSAKIGRGVYIAAGAVVSSNAQIDDHVLVNFQVTVGHDARLGSHTVINPGARISGNVTVGREVLIGANAFIFQGKTVGDRCLIDALTYIDRDIEANMICSGKTLKVFKRVI